MDVGPPYLYPNHLLHTYLRRLRSSVSSLFWVCCFSHHRSHASPLCPVLPPPFFPRERAMAPPPAITSRSALPRRRPPPLRARLPQIPLSVTGRCYESRGRTLLRVAPPEVSASCPAPPRTSHGEGRRRGHAAYVGGWKRRLLPSLQGAGGVAASAGDGCYQYRPALLPAVEVVATSGG
jgi:hypothetical protein